MTWLQMELLDHLTAVEIYKLEAPYPFLVCNLVVSVWLQKGWSQVHAKIQKRKRSDFSLISLTKQETYHISVHLLQSF
jgi:hypothetical protein